MADNNPKKNERLRGRNYKYKENYIIILFVKGKENRFDEFEQRDYTVQNENENLIKTNRREISSYPVDPLENRYNHSKAKKEGHKNRRNIPKNVY